MSRSADEQLADRIWDETKNLPLVPEWPVNFDDYDDHIEGVKQREVFENLPEERKQAYYAGKIRWQEAVNPLPWPERRYPQYTWRATDRIEEVVRRIANEVSYAPRGIRNERLNRAAFFFGKLVQGGRLDVEHAVYQLSCAAHDAGLPMHEAWLTVQSGMKAGMRAEGGV